MALSDLQRRVMRTLARNRSETSYLAGGLMLNRDWPRRSDDIDVFHNTDEEVWRAAQRDIETLRQERFQVTVEVEAYGIVEARVADRGEETVIQWMSESRRRFFPLVRDEEWGARLEQADLAVNKVIAASTRSKARDFVDLVSVDTYMCPLGPLVLAAAGKPPHYSPQRIVDEIRRRGLSVANEEYATLRGIPLDWDPAFIRRRLGEALERAETYVGRVPADVVGCLAVNRERLPIEVTQRDLAMGAMLRRSTEEPEIMPILKN